MNTAAQRALTRTYQHQLRILRSASSAALTRAWDQYGNVDDEALAAWLRASVPILTSARRVNAQAGATYTARLLGLDVQAGALTPDGLVVRPGVSEADLLTRPVISMRTALAAGLAWSEAHMVAGAKAESLLATDMALAAREGAGGAAPDGVRWLKVPSGEACDWCEEMAGGSYGSAEDVPMHPNDTCDVVPETEGTIAVRDDATTPVPEDAPAPQVIDNPELGPVKG